MQAAWGTGEPQSVPRGFLPTGKKINVKPEGKEMQQFTPNCDQEELRGQERVTSTINELDVGV